MNPYTMKESFTKQFFQFTIFLSSTNDFKMVKRKMSSGVEHLVNRPQPLADLGGAINPVSDIETDRHYRDQEIVGDRERYRIVMKLLMTARGRITDLIKTLRLQKLYYLTSFCNLHLHKTLRFAFSEFKSYIFYQ